MLVDSLKITFMAGKGNRHSISLMIPKDTVPVLRKLVDPESRALAGVLPSNTFLFASTQLSEFDTSGWHALKDVCSSLDLRKPELVNATKNRHRVSTLYAALDVPKQDRQQFFQHMGHSEYMNRDVYQAPLALMGITKVGKQLLEFDKGNLGTSTSSSNATERVETTVQPCSSTMEEELKPVEESTLFKSKGVNGRI